jgi:hypothetical protein
MIGIRYFDWTTTNYYFFDFKCLVQMIPCGVCIIQQPPKPGFTFRWDFRKAMWMWVESVLILTKLLAEVVCHRTILCFLAMFISHTFLVSILCLSFAWPPLNRTENVILRTASQVFINFMSYKWELMLWVLWVWFFATLCRIWISDGR